MNTEELLESIELNTKYIKMNLYLILEPYDVVNLVEEYLEHCGTAIAKDVQQINDVEEASAVLAMAQAKAIWLQQVIEFYMSELERVIELELAEKLSPFSHLHPDKDYLLNDMSNNNGAS